MHIASVAKTPLVQFSSKSWSKFVQCAQQWMTLNTEESVIAEKAIQTFNITADHVPDVPSNVGYHRQCYMLFTNKEHIERARKRKLKENEGLYKMQYIGLPASNTELNIVSIILTFYISSILLNIWTLTRGKMHRPVQSAIVILFPHSVTQQTCK